VLKRKDVRGRALPVAHDSLLCVDEPHSRAADRFVQLVFDAIFRVRLVPRLRPQITYIVRAAELKRNEMIGSEPKC